MPPVGAHSGDIDLSHKGTPADHRAAGARQTGDRDATPSRHREKTVRRRLVVLETIGAVAAWVGGYLLLIDPVRRFEVSLASRIIDGLGVDRISGALGDSFVVFGPELEPVVAEMTGLCSMWGSVLALAALAVVALRRRPHALIGFLFAAAFVLAANQLRLLGSLLAARYFAVDALVLFHDGIGAVLNLAYTFVGLLIMIGLTMYDARRAGRARPGHPAEPAEERRDQGAQAAAGVHREIPLARRAPYRTAETTGRLIAVTGAGSPAGVAVIRALQAAGDHVLALDADPDAVGLRLAGRGAVVPRADHPGYSTALLAVLGEHRPAALICTVAEDYHVLASFEPAVNALGVRTWLPDPAAAELCLDKIAFATTLHAAGVPHPVTAWTAAAATQVPGPWVVKPARGRGRRDVILVDDPAHLPYAFATVPAAIVQTRLPGREFTADALVARDGTLLACVPRWRDETRGTTFASLAVTEVVAAALRAVRHTGPAGVQGFVTDSGEATIVEVNPRFSGGLPLTLAAGADVVGTFLSAVLDPGTAVAPLGFRPGVRMARHFAEVYYTADGTALPDPLAAHRPPAAPVVPAAHGESLAAVNALAPGGAGPGSPPYLVGLEVQDGRGQVARRLQ
ncbi:ATP-grasp domain-containing protein [Actinoplanes philippinensis]|uniref:ATP-grasp domain-containing protein n=1 Tax=Actinoplanes philippinensis TaxID=35752 RepID=UPI0015A5ABBA|nr:ATP-grasp domain-containing protein [Actinoplanes philippinensis]